MKRRSNKFHPGQRLIGTMLTVVDSVDPLTWDDVVVLCDCGNQITIPYMAAYRRQFSCGCKHRLRQNAVDATGQRYWNAKGNKRIRVGDGVEVSHGRALQIVCRDPETQRWMYVCECCAETFVMPGGQERSPESMLRKLAGETCPNFRPFYSAPFDQMQGCWDSELGNLCAKVGLGMTLMPDEIVRYYTKPDYVVRDKFGSIEGFKGLPDSPEFMKLLERYRQKIIAYRNGKAAPSARQERELPHEDEFAEADY